MPSATSVSLPLASTQKNIQAMVKPLVREGIGATVSLGAKGDSYGGCATIVGLTEFPDTFAAATNLFGMFNFGTFFVQSAQWAGTISTYEYADAKTRRQLRRDLSTIHKLDQVRKPLLLSMLGANDSNVPVMKAAHIVEILSK